MKAWFIGVAIPYAGERDTVPSSYTNNGTGFGWLNGNRWYHRSVRPTEIRWSNNGSQSHRMRVRLTYANNRRDWYVRGWDDSGYSETYYTKYKLSNIYVEVYANGNWQQLRRYELIRSLSVW